jgi:hypothetical protein
MKSKLVPVLKNSICSGLQITAATPPSRFKVVIGGNFIFISKNETDGMVQKQSALQLNFNSLHYTENTNRILTDQLKAFSPMQIMHINYLKTLDDCHVLPGFMPTVQANYRLMQLKSHEIWATSISTMPQQTNKLPTPN